MAYSIHDKNETADRIIRFQYYVWHARVPCHVAGIFQPLPGCRHVGIVCILSVGTPSTSAPWALTPSSIHPSLQVNRLGRKDIQSSLESASIYCWSQICMYSLNNVWRSGTAGCVYCVRAPAAWPPRSSARWKSTWSGAPRLAHPAEDSSIAWGTNPEQYRGFPKYQQYMGIVAKIVV